jgi:diaminopimelate decarboxylase
VLVLSQELAKRQTGDIEQLKFLSPDEVRYVGETFGTPAFVYDEATLERNAAYMAALPHAFGLSVRYSLKACASQAIIRLFSRMGLLFDASSIWEVRRAVRAGVDPGQLLLTAQEVPFDQLEPLVAAGLEVDAGSLLQLDLFGRALPGHRVSIRINPGFGSGLVNRLTSGGPNSSFGIWHGHLDEVRVLLRQHGLKLVRLHTHVGSGHDAGVLLRAAHFLVELAETFPDVEVINLGGGYRVKAMLDDPEPDHRAWAEAVMAELEGLAAKTGRRLRLELEPGTFLMANAGSIVARVIDVVTTGASGHTFVKIDAGLTEIIRPSYYGAAHPLVSVPAAGPMREDVESYCVAGHCCIAGDVLTTQLGQVEHLAPRPLARTLPGDYLVVERGGGYCSSMSLKNFNSYPEAPEVLRRKDGSFDLIRSRQTLDQMVENERLPADLRQLEPRPLRE